ncbi:MAG: thermonuclease family protein [Alphaproteobacteria bacterium]|nr:thermonuclease family protein [Alphaproteobacteria bacterium]
MKTSNTIIAIGLGIGMAFALRAAFNMQAAPAPHQSGELARGMRLSGPAHVHDGDTIRITFNGKSQSIRIFGIDAPELDQTCTKDGYKVRCGLAARDLMVSITQGRTVTCTIQDIDRYKRLVAQCEAGGYDLGRTMVRAGAVYEYKRYSGGLYAADEAYAQSQRLGLWDMAVESPAHYRACRSNDPTRPRPSDCL